MAFDQFYAINSTNQMSEVTLRSVTTGQLLPGVAYDAITARYIREGSDTQVTVSVVAASQGVYSSGGWIETGIAGVYQFGIPNAALAAGAKAVTLVFSASGAIDVVKRIVLVSEDLRDALISSRLAPATAGRTLDVDANGIAAANVTEQSESDIAAAVRAELAAELANIDAAVSSRLASSSYTEPLDATETQAAAAAALAAYDPPMKLELDSAVALLATAATLAEVGSNVNAIRLITDELDVSAVTQVLSSMAGHLVITIGLTFDESVSGLVIPADWKTAYWTLKTNPDQPDSDAIVQLCVSNPALATDGLLRLNGNVPAAPVTKDDGALTVDQSSGRISVLLSDELTVRLKKAGGPKTPANAIGWDAKFIAASGRSMGRRGTAAIVPTETQITS
jgi:hypothetical protein